LKFLKVMTMNFISPSFDDCKIISNTRASDEIDPVEVFASWSRVITGAPIENRPALFRLMAMDAAAWADAIDDVFEVAADGLSPTFARACREADAARRPPRARRPVGDRPPTSTRITIDWLLKHCDAERLRTFLEARPEAELAKIKNYIAEKV
jgi:hypothetical protein